MDSYIAQTTVDSSIIAMFGRGSQTIKIDLPSDNMGFWLTQGLPLTLFFAHILLAIVDQRSIGVCFVPNIQGKPLSNHQVTYITEYCVDQATDFECFRNDSTIRQICRSTGKLCTQWNGTFETSRYFDDDNDDDDYKESTESDIWSTRFFYRNYIWFLLIFALIRYVPHIFFKFYCTANIVTVMEEFLPNYERAHNERNGDSAREANRGRTTSPKQRASYLLKCYLWRKFCEVLLDLVVIIALSLFFRLNSTLLNKRVFVCDLYADRDNLFLCSTIQTRFVSCAISFGFEFMMTLIVVMVAFVLDGLVQTLFVIIPLINRRYDCWTTFKSRLCFNPNDRLPNVDQNVYSNNEVYLIKLLLDQNKAFKSSSSTEHDNASEGSPTNGANSGSQGDPSP